MRGKSLWRHPTGLAVALAVLSFMLPPTEQAAAQSGSSTANGANSYYLVVYTDIGPDSTSPAAIQAGLTGADWVELLETYQPGNAPRCTIDTCPVVENTSAGFSPTTSELWKAPGVLVDESGHPWTWRVAYPLTGSQFLAAGNFLADVHLPDYGLDISDCQGGGDCYSFANYLGDSAWNKFAGGPLASNCQGLVQAVMDQSGLNADGHPVSIYPPDPTYSPGLDPVDVYEALTKGYVGISSAVVEKNPQPLDYSGADVEPPDACSVYNLESAALEDPEALAASLGLSYHKQKGRL